MLIELDSVSLEREGGIFQGHTHPTYQSQSVNFKSKRGQERTMATFLPNWFLISPSFMASGASSLMIEASCLIPMLANCTG